MTLTIEQIAQVCHETNRAYCQVLGDDSQVPWDQAEEWQRDSSIQAVQQALAGATPREQHESWCVHRREHGWVYGGTKDVERKTHPCLVPYHELPPDQMVKDLLLLQVVGALVTGQSATDRLLAEAEHTPFDPPDPE